MPSRRLLLAGGERLLAAPVLRRVLTAPAVVGCGCAATRTAPMGFDQSG